MNQSDEEALDPEMVALLRAELALPSAAVRERVSSRLLQSVGALALSRASATRPRTATGSPGSALAALRAHPLGFAASFLLGAAVGSGVYAAVRRAEPARVVYVDRPAAPAAAALLSVPLKASSGSSPSSPPARASSGTVAAPSASAEHVGLASLAEQQALLDVARSAFARSDYSATLAALNAHFRRYPKSVLGEEREALAIKALAASGREPEARARAARFKAQFPQSLLLPSVKDSVGAIP